jgi:DNA-binding GntR family transcriptional regulator
MRPDADRFIFWSVGYSATVRTPVTLPFDGTIIVPKKAQANIKSEENGSAGGPRYAGVAEALMVEISEGRYEVGANLPTEQALCKRFGVSRSTIRQALSEIESAGLVERRQGSGTRLVATRPTLRYGLSVNSESDILRYVSETILLVSGSAVPAPVSDGRRLRLGDPAQWSRWKGVRKSVDERLPLGTVSVYLPNQYADVMRLQARQQKRAIFDLISRSHGVVVTAIEQDISATVLDASEADLLEAQPGDPALSIVRKFYSAKGLIEVSETIHPSDRFIYQLRLERSG